MMLSEALAKPQPPHSPTRKAKDGVARAVAFIRVALPGHQNTAANLEHHSMACHRFATMSDVQRVFDRHGLAAVPRPAALFVECSVC
jgi:hypothetical protein